MRAMGALWTQVEASLSTAGLMQQDVKIATTGPKGTLFISNGKDVWELFMTKMHGPPSDENCSIAVLADNCARWGISEAEAKGMIEAARAKLVKRE